MALERVQILLSLEQRQKLRAMAQARGESMSEITRQAIDAGLNQLAREEEQKRLQTALEAARRLRDSMPLLNIDVVTDIRQLREERDNELFSSH